MSATTIAAPVMPTTTIVDVPSVPALSDDDDQQPSCQWCIGDHNSQLIGPRLAATTTMATHHNKDHHHRTRMVSMMTTTTTTTTTTITILHMQTQPDNVDDPLPTTLEGLMTST